MCVQMCEWYNGRGMHFDDGMALKRTYFLYIIKVLDSTTDPIFTHLLATKNVILFKLITIDVTDIKLTLSAETAP